MFSIIRNFPGAHNSDFRWESVVFSYNMFGVSVVSLVILIHISDENLKFYVI